MSDIEKLVRDMLDYPEKLKIILFLLKKMEYTQKKIHNVNPLIELIEKNHTPVHGYSPFKVTEK
jgi:hypothetical protein